VLVLFAGQSKRTFVHIKDAVAAYAFVLDHVNAMRGKIFNVGSERLNYSKQEIAKAIEKLVPCEVIDSSMPTEDDRNFSVSYKRLHSLGYKTRYTLEDGIRELIKLYSFYRIHSHHNVI